MYLKLYLIKQPKNDAGIWVSIIHFNILECHNFDCSNRGLKYCPDIFGYWWPPIPKKILHLVSFLFSQSHSQTIVRGAGLIQKNLKIFQGPLHISKISGPLCHENVSHMKKYVNKIFTGKFCIFFNAPITRVKLIKGPIFASAPQKMFVNDS